MNEHIEVIRALWTQDNPQFDGRFTRVSGIQQRPTPVQSPHPPIVIGGMSQSALRRAVRQGNGWYGFRLDLEVTEQCIAGLRKAADEHPRPDSLGKLEITVTPPFGPIDLDTTKRYEDLGVSRLVLIPGRLQDEGSPGSAAVRFVEETAEKLGL